MLRTHCVRLITESKMPHSHECSRCTLCERDRRKDRERNASLTWMKWMYLVYERDRPKDRGRNASLTWMQWMYLVWERDKRKDRERNASLTWMQWMYLVCGRDRWKDRERNAALTCLSRMYLVCERDRWKDRERNATLTCLSKKEMLHSHACQGLRVCMGDRQKVQNNKCLTYLNIVAVLCVWHWQNATEERLGI